MRIVAIALLLGACFTKPPRPDDGGGDDAQPPDGPVAEGFLPGYAARKRIDITPPTTSELTEFPIVIAINDADIAARARVDGADLVATDVDGVTLLRSELVDYKTGAFELWVKLPVLEGARSIYLYYGGSEVTPDPATWSPLFAGVWHLSGSLGESDSTSNTNDLGSAIPPTSVAGVIGKARSFDGIDDILFGGNPSTFAFGLSSFSYSIWANVTLPSASGFGTGFFKGGTNEQEPGFCWLLGNNNWTAKIHDTVPDNFAETEIGPATAFAGRWVHLTAVVDRTAATMTAYVDGQLAATAGTTGIGTMTTAESLELSHNNGGEPFSGLLDEIHIYSDVVSRDWVRTEFANQSGAPNFMTVQAEELAP